MYDNVLTIPLFLVTASTAGTVHTSASVIPSITNSIGDMSNSGIALGVL